MSTNYPDMWHVLSDTDQYLYHYTRATTLAKLILPSGKLRFSRFQNVNDPWEAKEWLFDYGGAQGTSFDDTDALGEALNRTLKDAWRVGCFVKDVKAARYTKEEDDLRADPITAMYERGHSRPGMWAHYGDNQKGACLVFAAKKLTDAIAKVAPTKHVLANKVDYVTNPRPMRSAENLDHLFIPIDLVRRVGAECYAKRHADHYANNLFFTKQRDWEHEREYRILVFDTSSADFFVPIDDALVGILVGEKIANYARQAVGRYALKRGTSVAEMRWQNGVPQPSVSHPRIFSMWPPG